MLDNLPGCREKLRRAEEHLYLLGAEIQEFAQALAQGQPYTVGTNVDPATGNMTLELVLPQPVPVLRWGALAGDAIHNLRAVLDHMVEELTIRNHGSAIPKTEFPIFELEFGVGDHYGFLDTKADGVTPSPQSGRHKVREVGSRFEALIEELQPYRRVGDVDNHPLLRLHRLDISDKHRVLPVVAMSAQVSSGWFGSPGQGVHIASMDGAVFHSPFPLEDGAEIPGVILGPGTTPDVDMNLDLALEVLLEDPETGAHGPLFDGLDIIFVGVAWIAETANVMLE